MTYSLFIILSAFLLIIYWQKKYKDERFINAIFFLMWVIFSIEFYTTRDYPVYYEGFYERREHWEFLYMLLVDLFQPFGFITFNACVSAFEIFTLCFIFKKIVPPRFRWVSLAVLILSTDNLFIFMNLKRQFFAMMVSMWIIYFLLYSNHKYRYIYAVLTFLCAINIHSSAYSAIGYFILPFLKTRLSKRAIFIIIAIFIASYSFRLSTFSDQLSFLLATSSGQAEYYEQYILQQADYEGNASEKGIFNLIFNFLLFLLLLIFNKSFDDKQYKFVLCSIASIILMNILKGNFFRLYLFYSIFNILTISLLLQVLYEKKKIAQCAVMLSLALAISTKSYLNAFVFDKVTYMTIKYKHFYTIFHKNTDKRDYLF